MTCPNRGTRNGSVDRVKADLPSDPLSPGTNTWHHMLVISVLADRGQAEPRAPRPASLAEISDFLVESEK